MRLPAFRILAIVVCLLIGNTAFAQVSLNTLGATYTETFDNPATGMPAAGSVTFTNNTTVPGWYSARTGTGTTVVANNGSSNAGNLYSYGTGTSVDRALGSVGSGNAAIGNLFWGVRLLNNTGSTITSLDVSYVGEQWRNSAAAAQTVAFSYLVGSPTVTGTLAEFQSAGVAVAALNFTSPITGGAAAALDGNLAANRVLITSTIAGLSIPNGTEIMLRWSDPDHTGGDHGLAVDDVNITPQGGSAPVTPTLNIDDVTMAEGDAGGTTFTFNVSLTSPALSGGVTFDIATADGTATTADNDYVANSATGVTIAEGNSGTTFNVTVNGDTTFEPAETFFVNVTNIVGANAGDTQGLGTITNDDAAPPAAEVLIISEYIEGSSNNKALEIYNTSTAAVDLTMDGYQIEVYFNGATTPGQTIPLNGTIGPGDGFVIANTSANATILAAADQTSGGISFNGNDAVILRRGGALGPIVDSLGQVGFNPGTEWGTGLTSTANNTIRRKATICTGDTNPTDVFDPSVEYDGFANDTFSGLGSHTAFCAAGPTLIINDVTQVEGNSGVSSFTFTVSLTVPAEMGGVTFDIATADGTALVADNDYVAKMLTGQTIIEGNSTYMFTVDVNGDTTVEANETFFVNVTNIIGANPGDTQGIATIQNDDVTLIPIHTIQGSGASSPLVGADVTTSGIVTGLKNNGFFIQTPDAAVDADPATSQGIFVFTSATPTVAVGDEAQVSGTVVEFVPAADPQQPPLTEISSPTVVVLNSGNPLPAPVVLDATFPSPSGGHDQLERVEGMRVTVPSMTVVAPTQGNINEPNATVTSTGVFFGVVTGVPRPFREPGIQDPDTPPSGSIPPIPRWDHNPELIRVDSDGLTGTSPVDVGTGQTIASVTGPLDFGFRYYTILPEATLVPAGTTTATPVSTPAANEFTVASYNLQRFFDNVNDPAIGEPVLTTAAFEARLNKASLAIRNFLLAPDIIGVQEVENLSTLQALASRINADAVAALQPNPQYVAYLEEGNDVGGIDVGFLVKTAPVSGGAPRVTVNAVVQENASEIWNSPPELLNDRPPLRLDAIINTSTGQTFPVTVINNHLRSLIGVEENTATGDRVRRKRHAQAVSLANLVQARQIANPAERIILVGDFNAFEFNDGYADVINTILGTPTLDDQTVVPGDGVDVVNPDLVNLVTTTPAGERYSFTFDGSAQNLDHVIINQALIASAAAYRLEHARIDADFPQVLYQDGTIAQRLSDHDPSVAFFAIPIVAPAVADLSVVVTADPALAVPGQNATFTVTVTNAGPADATNVVVTDALPAGTTFVSATPLQGSCSGTGPVTCTLGTLLSGGTATITIVVTLPGSGGPFTNTATAVSDQSDPTGATGSGTVTLLQAPAIPTLSEWALMLLAMMLAGFAVMRIRA